MCACVGEEREEGVFWAMHVSAVLCPWGVCVNQALRAHKTLLQTISLKIQAQVSSLPPPLSTLLSLGTCVGHSVPSRPAPTCPTCLPFTLTTRIAAPEDGSAEQGGRGGWPASRTPRLEEGKGRRRSPAAPV